MGLIECPHEVPVRACAPSRERPTARRQQSARRKCLSGFCTDLASRPRILKHLGMSLKECLKLTGLIHRVLLNGSLTPPTCSRTLSCLSKTRTHYAFCPRTPAALHVLRGCSSAPQADFTVSHQQLKQLLSTRTGVVIDVREPWELREYGSIPGSINVPLGQVNQALQLTPDDFREKYGSDMPCPNDQVVFSCLAGIRSKKALDAAVSLGYSNVQHYPGGWEEWAEREMLRTKH